MTGLEIESIDALSDGQAARVQAIYEDAFRPEMRVPFAELTRLGATDLTVVALAAGVPAGLAALKLLTSADWTFLRFFAITSQRRSQGLGRQFWQLLRERLHGEQWPARVIFEVQDPDGTASEPERLIRLRRVAFWAACGARQLPAPGYVEPDFTACGTTEPMLLMAAAGAAPSAVSGHELRTVVQAIYTDRYRLAPDDPMVVRALASIP